jgi:hypothetical protein
VNIDSQNRIVRRYHHIPRLAGPANAVTIARYVEQDEIMGKANLIYSLYRTSVLKSAIANCSFPSCWGGDMCFTLAAIARGGVWIEPTVRFRKRIAMHDEPFKADLPVDPIQRSFPLQHYRDYMDHMVRAVPKVRWRAVVAVILSFRQKRLVRWAAQTERGKRPSQLRSGFNLCADVAMSTIGAIRALWRSQQAHKV